MKSQPNQDVGKHTAGEKGQGAGKSNRFRLNTWTPDFGIRVAPVDPIASEKPIRERGEKTSPNDDRHESDPVHTVLPQMCGHCTRSWARTLGRLRIEFVPRGADFVMTKKRRALSKPSRCALK